MVSGEIWTQILSIIILFEVLHSKNVNYWNQGLAQWLGYDSPLRGEDEIHKGKKI